jgi:hypothetical protein
MSIYSRLLISIAALSLSFSAISAEFKKPLIFPHGKTSTTVKSDVIRGDRDAYLIKVRSGQVMTVQVSALENNASFSIYEPKAEDAILGSEEESDPTEWKGTLNKTGEYRIVVGGARGNASYTLRVTVK